MSKFAGYVLGMALIGAVPTAAKAQHMNQSDAPCRASGGGASLTACFDVAAKAADEKLNETYSRIANVLQADEQHRLRKSERAWLIYRDTFCDGEYGLYSGGSGGPAARLACEEALTRHHENDLEAAYGWRVEKFSDSDASRREDGMVDQIIERLDITTFPNSVGPRREPEKHTFADYGFVRVQKQTRGAVLTEDDGSWEMSFNIVATSPHEVDICFQDDGVGRPGEVPPTYRATSALRIIRSNGKLWAAAEVREGFPGCANNPPMN